MKMTKQIGCIVAVMLLALSSSGFCSSSFLEYTQKSEADLKAETTVLSKEIRKAFKMSAVEQAQEKIDAYDYFSHFKRLLLYGEKLATYSKYKEDLKFAKNNELFKGLPEDIKERKRVKSDFIEAKYERMSTDVANEIESYQDLIAISLDACELMTTTGFSGVEHSDFLEKKVKSYLSRGQDYQKYMAKQAQFSDTWPGIALRIQQQVDLWGPARTRPDDRLIDPDITEAIGHEGDV